MRLLPDPERLRAASTGNQGLGQGAEIAIGILVFFAIGAGIDWLAGTSPVFMIALTVFCAVGQFVRIWYSYDSQMKKLEADRARNAVGGHVGTEVSGDGGHAR